MSINRWSLTDITATCICDDGTSFIIDAADYPRVSQHNWYKHRKSIEGHVGGGRCVSLSSFILFDTDEDRRRVLRRNRQEYDYRRSNLFCDNIYHVEGDVAIGECFDGRTFVVDLSLLPTMQQYIWHIDKNNYVITKYAGRVIKQHRLLMKVLDRCDVEVDHVNHDTTDNRLCNLRLATRSQNCQNRNKTSHNTSGHVGVYWAKAANKWAAQVNANGKRYYLGVFDTIEDAAVARDNAAKAYHGEFYN